MADWVWWVLVGIFVVAGPIACSAFICAPKWYREKVAPTAVGRGLSRANEWLEEKGKPDKPKKPPSKVGLYAHMAMFTVLLSPILLTVLWVHSWRVIILHACPYTRSDESVGPVRRIWGDVRSFYSELENA